MSVLKFSLLLLVLLSFPVNAEDLDQKRVLAEALVKLMDTESMMDGIYNQVNQLTDSFSDDSGLSEEQIQIKDKYMQKITALMKVEMGWEKFKEPTIAIYTKHFTQAELQGMVDFYQSEVGQSMVKKLPDAMAESFQQIQPIMINVMPQIQKLSREMADEMFANKDGH